MADADLTYDFARSRASSRELDAGADLVMGDRMDSIQPGAMPWLNRYVGNPLLSGFLNLLYRTKVRDVHCGMRALRRDVLPVLDLARDGDGVRLGDGDPRRRRRGSTSASFRSSYHPRGGESKLSPFRDGWRHLRLILVYSPTFLFLIPGAVMAVLGALLMLTVFAHVTLFGREFFVHTLIVGSLLMIVGIQVIGLGLCGRAYGVFQHGRARPWFERMQSEFRLEHGLLLGAAFSLVGLVLGGIVVGAGSGADSAPSARSGSRSSPRRRSSSPGSRCSSPRSCCRSWVFTGARNV